MELSYEEKIEVLAKDLHEAGREAVEKGATVAAEKHKDDEKKCAFVEWNDISEHVKEGRRIQSRWLLEHYRIIKN